MTTVADQLAALPQMSAAQLRTEWLRVCGEPAPSAFGLDLLARGIAHRLQESIDGSLSASAVRRLERRIAQIDGQRHDRVQPVRAGTRLAREWHGRTHHVLVAEDGYHYCDRRYHSLTAIAREITGTAWSGPRFFGLTGARAHREADDAAA